MVLVNRYKLPRCVAPRMSECRLKCSKQTLVVATVGGDDNSVVVMIMMTMATISTIDV
jgi:hypothetical protein